MVPVVVVLRRVSAEEFFSEARLGRIAEQLVLSGLRSSRELRIGLPTDPVELQEMVTGLAGEVAASIGNENQDEIAVLLHAAAVSVQGLSLLTCRLQSCEWT